MSSTQQEIPPGATFRQARSVADARTVMRLVGEDEPIDRLPPTPEGYYSRGSSRLDVIVGLAVFIGIVGGNIVGVYAIAASDPELQEFPMMLVLMPALLPALAAIGAVLVLAPRDRRNHRLWREWHDVLRDARRERTVVHRIWVEFSEGDLSGMVVWAKTAHGAAVIAARLGPSRSVRPVSEQLPREGDEAWAWRTPDGRTFLQVPLRRVGLPR